MKKQIKLLKKKIWILNERINKMERKIIKQNKVGFYIHLFTYNYDVHTCMHLKSRHRNAGTILRLQLEQS